MQGAAQIWAHVGHSGWRDTHDVELQRVNGAEGVWVGEVQVPAQRLNTPTHLEVGTLQGIVSCTLLCALPAVCLLEQLSSEGHGTSM